MWAGLQRFLGLPAAGAGGASGGADGGGGDDAARAVLEPRASDRPAIAYLRNLSALQAALGGEAWGDMLREGDFDERADAADAFAEACWLHAAEAPRGRPPCPGAGARATAGRCGLRAARAAGGAAGGDAEASRPSAPWTRPGGPAGSSEAGAPGLGVVRAWCEGAAVTPPQPHSRLLRRLHRRRTRLGHCPRFSRASGLAPGRATAACPATRAGPGATAPTRNRLGLGREQQDGSGG